MLDCVLRAAVQRRIWVMGPADDRTCALSNMSHNSCIKIPVFRSRNPVKFICSSFACGNWNTDVIRCVRLGAQCWRAEAHPGLFELPKHILDHDLVFETEKLCHSFCSRCSSVGEAEARPGTSKLDNVRVIQGLMTSSLTFCISTLLLSPAAKCIVESSLFCLSPNLASWSADVPRPSIVGGGSLTGARTGTPIDYTRRPCSRFRRRKPFVQEISRKIDR